MPTNTRYKQVVSKQVPNEKKLEHVEVVVQEIRRIMSQKEVQRVTSLSGPTIWRMVRSGKFPRKVHLSKHRVGWFYDDVTNWMSNLSK